jgi:methylenetetrahydrofolate reductase (NADPH)
MESPHGSGTMVALSRLHAAFVEHRFAVTTELSPPRGAGTDGLRKRARALRPWVDAANITDNQSAMVRMASWGGSLVVLAEGLEPVMQVQCRDRNRMALQSDLLAASALGIGNIVLMTGDKPEFGDHPDAPGVFDLNSATLLAAARTMRDGGRLLSGRELRPPPRWLVGAVEDPFAPGAVGAERLAKKVEAGAEFVQTQFVFEVDRFAAWMTSVRDAGLAERCAILAGVGPIRSHATLARMQEIPGIHIPASLIRRLEAVTDAQVAAESLAVAAEIIRELRDVPGVAGVHVMAVGMEGAVPELIERAGLGRR